MDGSGLMSNGTITTKKVIKELRRAAEMPKVAAIVLRIDSPGEFNT